MLKSRKFNKMIEKQSSEEKEKLWQNISAKLDTESISVTAVKKKPFWTARKIAACCSAVAVIAIVSISVSVNALNSCGDIRYCYAGDYYWDFSDYSADEYSAIHESKILYFEIETKDRNSYEGKLYSTNETVCFMEEIVNIDEVFIDYYVTPKNIVIDLLDYSNTCLSSTRIDGVEVSYGISFIETYAYFEYNGYKYNLRIDTTDENYMLSLCETLLT